MRRLIPPKISSVFAYLNVLRKQACHSFSKAKLPPGDLANLYTREIRDQTYLLNTFKSRGPIVKTRMAKYLTICVLGLKRCRQLLLEHGERLPAVSFELKPIIPHGYLRGMEGETHKKYRAILMRGIQANAMEQHRDFHREIIATVLARYHRESAGNPTARAYIDACDTICQSIMLHLFFGARYGTEYHDQLTGIYTRMWDRQWHFYCQPEQVAAYEDLKTTLLKKLNAASKDPDVSESILGRIHRADALDETILGNLIYMVETGRFAVYSLMRWSTKYAVENPEAFRRIATDPKTFANERECPAQAFVQETMRLNQTERLLRHVKESFVFEGFLFPKGSIVRLCLWESHKSAEIFPDPFHFNPQRFIDNTFSLDQYAPFGVGSHRCPLGSLSIQICRLFLHTLATHYALEAIGNGPPFRGIAHYEPAKDFTVRLHTNV